MYTNDLNSPLKACFSNDKYLITIQTRPTKIAVSTFLIEQPVFNGILKIIGVQNQLPITFSLNLVCNQTSKVRNSTPTHTNFSTLTSYYTSDPNKKQYENSLVNILFVLLTIHTRLYYSIKFWDRIPTVYVI